jgi:hypothetical protein
MSDFLNPVKAGLEAAGKSLSVVDSIISQASKYSELKKASDNYLRALYLEADNNLELLESINSEKLKSCSPNCPMAKTILSHLSVEVAGSVLFSVDEKKDSRLYSFLTKKGKLDEGVSDNNSYVNVLQAISFVVVKIEFLKKMAALESNDLEFFKPLKFSIRIQHIRERLLIIKKELSEVKAVKDMARYAIKV